MFAPVSRGLGWDQHPLEDHVFFRLEVIFVEVEFFWWCLALLLFLLVLDLLLLLLLHLVLNSKLFNLQVFRRNGPFRKEHFRVHRHL